MIKALVFFIRHYLTSSEEILYNEIIEILLCSKLNIMGIFSKRCVSKYIISHYNFGSPKSEMLIEFSQKMFGYKIFDVGYT